MQRLKGQYKNKYMQNGVEHSLNQSALTFIPMISHGLSQFYVEQGLLGREEGERLQEELSQQMTLDLLL